MRDCDRAVSFRSICSLHYSRSSEILVLNFFGFHGGLFEEQHLMLQQRCAYQRFARYFRHCALHPVAGRKQLGYFLELPSDSGNIPRHRGMFVPAEWVRHKSSFTAIHVNCPDYYHC